jgi:hypothetical protein
LFLLVSSQAPGSSMKQPTSNKWATTNAASPKIAATHQQKYTTTSPASLQLAATNQQQICHNTYDQPEASHNKSICNTTIHRPKKTIENGSLETLSNAIELSL